jgi:hypothetical protein
VTLVRQCCCNPQEPIVCCGEWPTYCATPVGLGYWFYSLHRSLIHHGSSITLAGLTPVALSASFVGSTTAVDPETLLNECSFPDPIDQYPYPVLMPGFAQTPIRPWNYSVPVFRGSSTQVGDYEIVWPILQKCCIGGSYDQLVVGLEIRGSDLIGKIVAQLGTSPNNLTGAYNGTGRHWYSLPNGNFRFFADPGLWERDGLGAGLPSFSPFRLGHESGPTIIEHTGAVPFELTHTNWCLENGYDNPCRCNFSFPEDPQCCEYYTASIYLRVANDGCATHEISTSCIMRRAPSPCPQGSPFDVVEIKNSLTRFAATVPNGTYTVDKINGNGCCVDYLPPNPPSTGFDVPFVSVAAIGCDLNPEDYPCLSCDLLPQTKFDALFCITTGYTLDADVPFGDPCAGRYVNSNTWYIGVYLRNNGDGCCIDGYRDLAAYFLNNVNGNCVWEPVLDFNITFDCED